MKELNYAKLAESWIKKLKSKDYTYNTIGLFLDDSKVKGIPPNNKKFDKQVKDFPKTFIGVYNKSITEHKLSQDIKFTHMKQIA